jgi:hypothetical protein
LRGGTPLSGSSVGSTPDFDRFLGPDGRADFLEQPLALVAPDQAPSNRILDQLIHILEPDLPQAGTGPDHVHDRVGDRVA